MSHKRAAFLNMPITVTAAGERCQTRSEKGRFAPFLLLTRAATDRAGIPLKGFPEAFQCLAEARKIALASLPS